jgi:hypothetical protein
MGVHLPFEVVQPEEQLSIVSCEQGKHAHIEAPIFRGIHYAKNDEDELSYDGEVRYQCSLCLSCSFHVATYVRAAAWHACRQHENAIKQLIVNI